VIKERSNAIVLVIAPLMTSQAGQIADLALTSRLPAIYASGPARLPFCA
jgi:hypothetical protein